MVNWGTPFAIVVASFIGQAGDASLANWGTPSAIVAASFVGLVIGYVIGYRGGKVAGELEAMKTSMRYDRARRHHGDRGQSRPGQEAPGNRRGNGE